MSQSASPLPRGRHKLSRDEVVQSQRERLLTAIEALVGEQGYAKTSVPQVVRRARVTGRVFYEQFEDKADCFIAACERNGDEIRAMIDGFAPVVEAAEDPLEAFNAGLRLYLQWWMERPLEARAFFLELPAAGERAFASRDRRAAIYADALERVGMVLRARTGGAGRTAPFMAMAAATVAIEVVAREVRAGRTDRLLELEHELGRALRTLLLADEAPTSA